MLMGGLFVRCVSLVKVIIITVFKCIWLLIKYIFFNEMNSVTLPENQDTASFFS